MTRIEELISRRDAQVNFCWSPFPEERLNGNDVNEGEVTFHHDGRYRADAKYNGGIAFANIY